MTETESLAILSAVETLSGEESQSRDDIISAFFSGEGELQGVACKDTVLPVETMSLTRDGAPDSRLIEIVQVIKNPHQDISGEDTTGGAAGEPDAGAGITAHGHAGSLLFVQESELENEIPVPPTEDVPPTDEGISYPPEPEPENKPIEATDPVCVFASLP